MRAATYHRHSLLYFWRTHVALVLAVLAGTAVLTGALLVGDSMRDSLRNLALRRLGPVDHALVANRFFRAELAEAVRRRMDPSDVAAVSPALLVEAGLSHAASGTRVNGANLLGIDDGFRQMYESVDRGAVSDLLPRPGPLEIVLNAPLAEALGAAAGDDVLVRLAKPGAVPLDTLLGRRDELAATLRLTIHAIVPVEGPGGFALKPRQYIPKNAFVDLQALQRALDQPGRVNALLAVGAGDATTAGALADALRAALAHAVTLADYNLSLDIEAAGYAALQSSRLLIEPPVERAAMSTASALEAPTARVLTYLANSIGLVGGGDGGAIPYSMVAGIDGAGLAAFDGLQADDGTPVRTIADDAILLNTWAAEDLGAGVGDRVRLRYYVTGDFGRLETRSAEFTLAGIVAMRGWGADPGFTPVYEGITDAANLADWDPPFPIDMRRIREKDEQYWDDHRGTPKAFISLARATRLWADASEQNGRLTAIRMGAAPNMTVGDTVEQWERALLHQLEPAQLGLRFEPVRQQALAAGGGSTDFGMLFLGFSFFLIASAAMLVVLIFRLGAERRAGEVGTLLALGFSVRRVSAMLVLQGALVAVVGVLLGLAAAGGYAWLMLAGLRSWWSAAVNAPFLSLNIQPLSLGIGGVGGLVIAVASVAWAVRGLGRLSPRALMAGAVQSGRERASSGRRYVVALIFWAALLLATGLIGAAIASGAIPVVVAFFGGGSAMLVASLAALAWWLRRERRGQIRGRGTVAFVRLGIRNATRQRGRSLLTASLIASATFVIVSVGANRHTHVEDPLDRQSGTGGFALLAESAVPIPYDLNAPAGRDALNLSCDCESLLNAGTVLSLRLLPGDDSSCLNLYKVQSPRIVGASDLMIDWGGFAFKSSLADTDAERRNPWLLLRRELDGGAVPAIGDYNTIMWLLKLGLGEDLLMTDERGRQVPLRIVGMLDGSILQGELVIAESNFEKLFPSRSGYRFFLIDTPKATADDLHHQLERELADYSLDVASSEARLQAYMAVENTYVSTFQTLGGLGLVLGTLGLAAVMLRNVVERRGELALLRALGLSQGAIGWTVLVENALLLVVGLAAGTVSALLAVAPHAWQRPDQVPWGSLAATLAIVLAVGMLASAAAVHNSLRTPLLPALRDE